MHRTEHPGRNTCFCSLRRLPNTIDPTLVQALLITELLNLLFTEEEDTEDAAAQALAAIGKETGSALQSSEVDDQKDEQAQRIDKLASSYRG